MGKNNLVNHLKVKRKLRILTNKLWKKKKKHTKGIKPVLNKCKICNAKIYYHHYKCEKCWLKSKKWKEEYEKQKTNQEEASKKEER